MDDFEKKFLTDTLANMSQNIFAEYFVSEHSKHFFYFEKTIAFFSGGGGGGASRKFPTLYFIMK